jgi:prepilin signal peptidase PulO-like enzyme (type II secretory pathway)
VSSAAAAPTLRSGDTAVRAAVTGAALLAWIGVLARFGASDRALVGLVFFAFLAVLTVTDLEQRRLPNTIVIPGALIVLALQIALVPERALEWVLASLITFLALLVVSAISRGGLGMGDVKLGLLLGAGLGAAVLPGLVVGMCAAGLYAVVLLARHGSAARSETLPYAPFLVFGAVVAFLFF